MSDAILVLNAGSSSIKFREFAKEGGALRFKLKGALEEVHGRARFRAQTVDGKVVGEHAWDKDHPPAHAGALQFLFEWLETKGGDKLAGIGHRVVHGGDVFRTPVRVDDDVLKKLDAFVPLAPLHQPHNLSAIRAVAERRPGMMQVACFDTAFHQTASAVAQAFALPPAITDRGVHRYGFHGLSYEYIASVLPQHDARAAAGRTVVLHLGNGASMCAMAGGKSVATTMGFTALDGLPMGTRSGTLDAGVVLYLIRELGMDVRAIEKLLYNESGLLGLSEISSDMRELLTSADPRAKFAIDVFIYRIVRELGSLAAALGGLDAVVFTAGIGEHATEIRERVCREAAWLGLEFDPSANAANGPLISTSASKVAAWVIPTNEELVIARHTEALL
jgi:acetate kinase